MPFLMRNFELAAHVMQLRSLVTSHTIRGTCVEINGCTAGFHTGFLARVGERMARLRTEKIKVPRPLLRCRAHLLNKVLMVPF